MRGFRKKWDVNQELYLCTFRVFSNGRFTRSNIIMAKPHIHCSIFRQKFMINICFVATPFSSYLLISCSLADWGPSLTARAWVWHPNPNTSGVSHVLIIPSPVLCLSTTHCHLPHTKTYIESFSFPQETFNLIFLYNQTRSDSLESCYLVRLPLATVSFIKAASVSFKFPYLTVSLARMEGMKISQYLHRRG